MHSVYIIQHTETREIYIGMTADLQRRLSEHNTHQQAATNRSHGVWVLVYAETYKDKRDASARERRLKHHGSAKHELLKRLKASLL